MYTALWLYHRIYTHSYVPWPSNDTILLVFSKAFDRVPHQHLYYKLHHYGIQGKLLDWVKQFLTGRSHDQCVLPPNTTPPTLTNPHLITPFAKTTSWV